ncbi:polyphosphate kinase 2 family protein, partial [bacterium]|nr:polyphosphate kinase 2 family protein [bacterium]
MERYRVKENEKIHLRDFDPGDTGKSCDEKDAGLELLGELNQDLEKLQELLYAEHKHRV